MSQAMKHSGKKVSHKKRNILIILVILVCLGVGFKFLVYDKLMDKATNKVTTEVLTSIGATNEEVQEVLNSMSDSDRAAIEGIIQDHASASSIQEITTYLKNNDPEALSEYADKNLSDEEKAQLYELYSKYYN